MVNYPRVHQWVDATDRVEGSSQIASFFSRQVKKLLPEKVISATICKTICGKFEFGIVLYEMSTLRLRAISSSADMPILWVKTLSLRAYPISQTP